MTFEGYVTAQNEDTARVNNVFTISMEKPQVWLYDTCAATHVCNDRTLFSRLYPANTAVGGVTANAQSSWRGDVVIDISCNGVTHTVTLKDVVLLPQCPVNLISACRLYRLTKLDFAMSRIAIVHGDYTIGHLAQEGDLL